MKKFDSLPDNMKGALVLVLAAFGFALMTALIKLAGSRLHVTQILFLRQIGMIVMLAPTLIGNFPHSLKTGRLDLQLIRLVFALVAMLTGFSAIINMPLADATAIGFAKSFFVTIFAVLVLKETVGVYRWSAVAIGFVGVLIMLQPGTDGFTIYSVYAIIGSACAGVVMVIIRLLSRTENPITILTYQAVGVAVVMIIPAVVYWRAPTVAEWGIIAAIGFVSYFAQKANIYAYKWGEASLLASLDYMRLLYATVLGFFLFGQLPGIYTWGGALLIVLASIYTVHREARRNQSLASSVDARGFSNH